MESKAVDNVKILSGTHNQLYSLNAIFWATIFGGPLAGCYLLNKNFKNFEQAAVAKKSLIIGILVTFLIAVAFRLLPQNIVNHIPHILIPAFYTTLICTYARMTQEKKIKEYLQEGWKKQPWWRTLIISTVSFVILVAVFVLVWCVYSIL